MLYVQEDGELFERYFIARELRSLVLCLFGVQWIMPSGVIDLLDCWRGGGGGERVLDIGMVIFGMQSLCGLC